MVLLRTLTYDRHGQGATISQDSVDKIPGKGLGYGYDLNDAVNDLHELIQFTVPTNFKLVLVAVGIFVHIARIYAHKHSATVGGLSFLDPNIGNAEGTGLLPNSHTPDFKESDVAGDDKNVLQLLLNPSSPRLQGLNGRGACLKVVGRDPEPFGKEMWRTLEIPKSVNRKYTRPFAVHGKNQ
ncbi:hypothetical protein BTUL_0004g01300 [Botrytis tulipae]|uniref:Uncharacterized protein n=1 Tax=Botrytis tulipae TaxID=87230 RepID=A0A4Z1FDJ6_9HELO|nr:hypothetical protein BTUL_0004g01300 [Botrytis tulipae]